MKDDEMDAAFQALANGDRRRILDIIKSQPGCCVNDVCHYFEISRVAVMKHLGILEAARLIHSEKCGRLRKLYFNTVPIQMIYDRWTTEYGRVWSSTLTRVKYQVEDPGIFRQPRRKR